MIYAEVVFVQQFAQSAPWVGLHHAARAEQCSKRECCLYLLGFFFIFWLLRAKVGNWIHRNSMRNIARAAAHDHCTTQQCCETSVNTHKCCPCWREEQIDCDFLQWPKMLSAGGGFELFCAYAGVFRGRTQSLLSLSPHNLPFSKHKRVMREQRTISHDTWFLATRSLFTSFHPLASTKCFRWIQKPAGPARAALSDFLRVGSVHLLDSDRAAGMLRDCRPALGLEERALCEDRSFFFSLSLRKAFFVRGFKYNWISCTDLLLYVAR